MKLQQSLIPVWKSILENGGEPYLVGGSVRDHLMGLPVKDFDTEVFKMELTKLHNLLSHFGKVDLLGEKFQVLRLHIDGGLADFSIPGFDIKNGPRHNDFRRIPDPYSTVADAQKRRDYSVNSIYAALRKLIYESQFIPIDYHGGLEDLKNKVLRATSFVDFPKDPLRVLRGVRFGGKLDFYMESQTTQLSSEILFEYFYLSVERIRDELWGWAVTSTKPSSGLLILEQTGWIANIAILADMVGIPQDKEHHPEGDVWQHTLHVVDEAARIATENNLSEEERGILVMAALLHDSGKPATTVLEDGTWKSPLHAYEGAKLADDFLLDMHFPVVNINRIVSLVEEHMWHIGHEATQKSVRKLIGRMGYDNIHLWACLIEADQSGRPPLPKRCPETVIKALDIAPQVKNQVNKIVLGRHLIESFGLQPSPDFTIILSRLYEKQMNGEFTTLEEGLQLAEKEIAALVMERMMPY